MLTIGSLFSGIGGLELGLERAGLGPVLWQVENDVYCNHVLARHWPNAQRFEDVRRVGAAALLPVDIICGGFPCQPVSLAGKGRGEDDERWLWPEFRRIVAELAPPFVVIENVLGLLRRGLDGIVSDLAALGYALEATRIRASDVGAPHWRERLFVVAYAERERKLQPSEGEREGRRRPGDGGRPVPPWPAESAVGRVADGIPRRVDRLRVLGNAVVPACAEIVGHRVLDLIGAGGR